MKLSHKILAFLICMCLAIDWDYTLFGPEERNYTDLSVIEEPHKLIDFDEVYLKTSGLYKEPIKEIRSWKYESKTLLKGEYREYYILMGEG